MSTRFHEHLNAFLLRIALAADLEVPALELSDRASDFSFTLSECWKSEGGADSRSMPQPKLPAQNVKSEDIEEEDDCLPWILPFKGARRRSLQATSFQRRPFWMKCQCLKA